jgi:lipopolysaccharide/colanic/teichoic acid biosynthesis glycosyltransferase
MRIYHIIKRLMDIFFSLILIIILFLLFIIIGIWVKATSPGPIVYKHTRIGKNGKPFMIYKFRTMVQGARDLQNIGVPTQKLTTSAGRFLRKTFLDETLQLFNILKGDISFVGPRPMDKETFEIYTARDSRWNDIIKIKPGLTSLESIADYLPKKERLKFEKHFKGLFRKDISDHFYIHRLVLDDYYTKNESFLFDLKMVYYTVLLALRRVFSSS